jgi:hypothetical protein
MSALGNSGSTLLGDGWAVQLEAEKEQGTAQSTWGN